MVKVSHIYFHVQNYAHVAFNLILFHRNPVYMEQVTRLSVVSQTCDKSIFDLSIEYLGLRRRYYHISVSQWILYTL